MKVQFIHQPVKRAWQAGVIPVSILELCQPSRADKNPRREQLNLLQKKKSQKS